MGTVPPNDPFLFNNRNPLTHLDGIHCRPFTRRTAAQNDQVIIGNCHDLLFFP